MHFEPSQCRRCRGPLQGWRAESLCGRGAPRVEGGRGLRIRLCPHKVPQGPIVPIVPIVPILLFLFHPFSIYPISCFLEQVLPLLTPLLKFLVFFRKGKAFHNPQRAGAKSRSRSRSFITGCLDKNDELKGHKLKPWAEIPLEESLLARAT